MLSKLSRIPAGIMIAMLTWSSAAVAEDAVLPPLGDVWITLETPRSVPAPATGSEMVALGDVWIEPSDHETAIAIAPRRVTTGMSVESRW